MWGCGVFMGDPLLKYLQQAMAAAQVDRKLHFSTFGNKKQVAVLTVVFVKSGIHINIRLSFLAVRHRHRVQSDSVMTCSFV
mmetsp:Transcript_40271/g.64718  ORF Transcript_40271/g.64718 Transcript_40271/m.64718 type:complete len:81 (+) Transcript_40271:1650-1892(+)